MQQPQNFAAGLVNIFTGLVTLFLGFRFILKLFGANAENDFVSWVYDMSGVLLAPFRGIFPTEVIDHQYVFEFNTLFALMVYAILCILLLTLINTFLPNITYTTATKRRK